MGSILLIQEGKSKNVGIGDKILLGEHSLEFKKGGRDHIAKIVVNKYPSLFKLPKKQLQALRRI